MSPSNKNSDYDAFLQAFIEAHPHLSKQIAWKVAKATWSKIKPDSKGNRESFDQKSV